MLQVYTGDGKGKTTAALGLALRAAGHGWRVGIIQFMKGSTDYGELASLANLPGIELTQTGLPTFVERGNPTQEDLAEAKRGLQLAQVAIASGRYRLLILDELNVAIDYGLVPLADVLTLVDACPAELELVITGRRARPELIERAALVSEIHEVKHPYRLGIVNRVGIDY